MSRPTRDRTAEPISRDQILRHARGQESIIFPVQLTTSRIGSLTRLIHTLLYVMTIHTYGYILHITNTLNVKNNDFSLIKQRRHFFPQTGGCSEGLGAFRFSLNNYYCNNAAEKLAHCRPLLRGMYVPHRYTCDGVPVYEEIVL